MEQVGVNSVPLKDIEESPGIWNQGGAAGSLENLRFLLNVYFFFKGELWGLPLEDFVFSFKNNHECIITALSFYV